MNTVHLKRRKCRHKGQCNIGVTRLCILEHRGEFLRVKLENSNQPFNAQFDKRGQILRSHTFLNAYMCHKSQNNLTQTIVNYIEAFFE